MTVAVAAAGAAACSSSTAATTTSSGSGPELTNITVPALDIPDALTLKIAQQDGFFKKVGLTVKIETIQAPEQLTAPLIAHQVGITTEDYVGMFVQNAQTPQLGLKVIADDVQSAPNQFGLVVPKGSPIKSVAGLKGKRIALPSLGQSIGSLTADALLNAFHLPANVLNTSDYTVVPLAFPEMPAAMAKHQADAFWVTEPFVTVMEAAGGHVLSDLMTGSMQNFPISCWAASAYYIQHYPKTVAAFTKAILQAQQVAAGNQALVRKMLPGFIQGLQPQIANVMQLGTFNTTVSTTRVQRVIDVMKQFHFALPKGITAANAVYTPSSGS